MRSSISRPERKIQTVSSDCELRSCSAQQSSHAATLGSVFVNSMAHAKATGLRGGTKSYPLAWCHPQSLGVQGLAVSAT